LDPRSTPPRDGNSLVGAAPGGVTAGGASGGDEGYGVRGRVEVEGDAQRWCIWWCILELVHRTNVYLTDEEQAALDARAEVEGSSRSVVLRSIVDEALNLTEGTDAIDAALAEAAGEIAETARHLSADDPELRAD
jgi:hypothetical protein